MAGADLTDLHTTTQMLTGGTTVAAALPEVALALFGGWDTIAVATGSTTVRELTANRSEQSALIIGSRSRSSPPPISLSPSSAHVS